MVGINDHVPVPVVNAVVMTADQVNDLKEFLADLHDREKVPPPAVLSDSQFAELKALLQPGYECSKIMLAQLQAVQPVRQELPANMTAAREAELAAANRANSQAAIDGAGGREDQATKDQAIDPV